MFVLSFIFAATLSPGASLKLAQSETKTEISSKTSAIEKAKTDLKAKIAAVQKKKKEKKYSESIVRELDKILDRLNWYLEYLDYLSENPSLSTTDKLSAIDSATDKILEMSDKLLLGDTEIIFTIGDFETVTQSDASLTYNPASAPNASGLISFIPPSSAETPGGDSGAGGGDVIEPPPQVSQILQVLEIVQALQVLKNISSR